METWIATIIGQNPSLLAIVGVIAIVVIRGYYADKKGHKSRFEEWEIREKILESKYDKIIARDEKEISRLKEDYRILQNDYKELHKEHLVLLKDYAKVIERVSYLEGLNGLQNNRIETSK